MWKLTNIKIKNIISLKEADFSPEQGVATLIYGQNLDNSNQPANGSGKSSLVEAISFAITGEQLRKVKSIEEIINDSEDEAYVKLTLTNDYDNTVFTIERTISRGSSQRIECHKYLEGKEEIETDRTIQPTVNDYNKFILSEIGITKEDLYNIYVLCDSKYESFFDASDKSKKEVINTFSNGIIVDESIAKLQSDMVPVAERLSEANDNFLKVSGKIAAIQEEIAHADEKEAEGKQLLQERIERLDSQILKSREEIEKSEAIIKGFESNVKDLKHMLNEVDSLKAGKMSVEEIYEQLKVTLRQEQIGIKNYPELIKNYNSKIKAKKSSIQFLKSEHKALQELFEERRKQLEESQSIFNTEKEHYDKVVSKKTKEKEELALEIKRIDERLDGLEKKVQEGNGTIVELDTKIHRAKTLLKGAVECPKCHHEFLVENKKSVTEVQSEINGLCDEKTKILKNVKQWEALYDTYDSKAAEQEDKIKFIEKELKDNGTQMDSLEREVKSLSYSVEEITIKVKNSNAHIEAEGFELDTLYSKIDNLRNQLFEEVDKKLHEVIDGFNQHIHTEENRITFLQGQISQYKQSKKQIEEEPQIDLKSSLKTSLERYEGDLKKAEGIKREIQEEYDKLKEQELNFVMFKSYLARKKIDALSLIVNDFLEKIGSDIRLKLEGFSVTKTGKLRDKISVQVMRDGIDCGSYQKFSGGEKARLNLACILSLHTLTNNNCDPGKGLDFLIIDELLDKSDEVGMTTYCEALNKLGQTALLITQGAVSEGYPHKLLIVKRQGVSQIQD